MSMNLKDLMKTLGVSQGQVISDPYAKAFSPLSETKFYAFWNGNKIEVEGNSLWDAKQKAITQLKVPKSKVGLLAVVNASEHDKGSFQFD